MTSYSVLLANGETLAKKVYLAKSLRERLRGLLGRTALPDNEGLLLDPCSSIHTVGMKFPIDVVFLDKHDRVTAWYVNVRPYRLLLSPWGTRKTLELAGGALDNQLIRKDSLYFERNSAEKRGGGN